MERAEKIGLGVASAGHVLLFTALSVVRPPDPLTLNNNPIEVSIADEVALRSAARKISEAPPPAPGEEEGPPKQTVKPTTKTISPPDPTSYKPAPAPTALPTPKAEPKKAEKPKPDSKASAADAGKQTKSRGSKLKLDLSGLARSESSATKASEGAPAATIGTAQKSALDAEIRRQLKPHWKAPSGADAESLRTIVTVKLAKDGSIIGAPEIVDTLGITASNRAQVQLHQEQAVKAIRLAAPFRLPPDLYSGWNFLRLTFDKRLSQ